MRSLLDFSFIALHNDYHKCFMSPFEFQIFAFSFILCVIPLVSFWLAFRSKVFDDISPQHHFFKGKLTPL
jgi:hypothetical protein